MSANGIKRRLQKDFSRLNKALRAQETKSNNRMVLPYFEQDYDLVPKHEQKLDFTQVGLAEGDLVYITKGEHKGKISTLFRYTPEFDTVYLSDVSEKKVVPPTQWFEQQESHLIDYPQQIPRDHVRLAAKDIDSAGKTYYIVADAVVYKDKYYDDRYKQWLPKRFVKHHESIEVPWPGPPTDPKDGELSTDEQVALEKTYEVQSIAIPPVPIGALDQLRNPHSKFKSKILTELDARRLTAPEMPLSKEQKIYLAKKAQQPPTSVKDLTEEMKQLIGEKMAQHLNQIENPYMKIHLDALSKNTTPEFEKTMKLIRETQELNKAEEQK
ncbi:39S ribosomal protein L40, mitochondrial [Yamadazyma tenuis]|uniref:KOW domain-containing protein n=1 Tax=Candida tenuis (strain ATCC 10573 / BCRC 21748 / CBS 615 / JCM 9827 / NBRC 10315 / NRRL Y-1498 / VKM Y-70) TaxID=590646 RepID=G3B3M4_CANTC|nr:uncharacterized protein CANTEDRAFT_114255 [Yamadazyma tenuis ATCC 10573]EGV64189.1 hypothetical protein CANTEDRAFT_114255 [Yamadazyma tenuis ATCC 10573]WEJ96151.1 39S ribosomal protein L40, mitochondrial [Yamadazyma tenuis]